MASSESVPSTRRHGSDHRNVSGVCGLLNPVNDQEENDGINSDRRYGSKHPDDRPNNLVICCLYLTICFVICNWCHYKMYKKDPKSVMDSEGNKWMGIGYSRIGKWDLLNIIIKGSYHTSVTWWGKEEIAWRKRSCRARYWERESKGDQGCDGLTTWKNGRAFLLTNFWDKQGTEGDGVDLFMK